MSDRTAIVVGAGMSGLAAAWRLKQAGVDVTVLEQMDSPGGYAQTVERDGYLVDIGPDAMTESYTHYLALLEELGFRDRVAPASPVVALARGNGVIDVDPTRPLSLVRNPVLSLPAKLALVRGYLKLRKEAGTVDGYEGMRTGTRLDDPDGNAWELSERHFNHEVAHFLDGVLRLTTGASAQRVSPVSVHIALDGWTVPILGVRGGMNLLPRAMAEKLDVRYRTRVTRVREEGDCVHVDYTVADGSAQTLSADGCVLAIMYEPALEVWPELRSFAPDYLDELEYVKLISISLGYAAAARTQAYTILTPAREQPDVLGIFMQQNKAGDRVPPGHTLTTLYTETDSTDRMLAMSDDELAGWASGVVESLCPELVGRRDLALVHRFPRTGYLPTPGFWRRTKALHQALPADGRIQLAGALFGAAGMEVAIRWGKRAAARLAGVPAAAEAPARV